MECKQLDEITVTSLSCDLLSRLPSTRELISKHN